MEANNILRSSWLEEEQIKETVYKSLNAKSRDLSNGVSSAKNYVESGSYEEQDAFIHHNALSLAKNKERDMISELKTVFEKPYFAHMELMVAQDDAAMHMFLSDSADLNHVLTIDDNNQIVPFKQSQEAPLLTSLFHCYQSRETEPFFVTVFDERQKDPYKTEYQLSLIRDVQIENRKLLNVMQLFPQIDESSDRIDVDDLLAKRLEENRSDARLRNIIATLQQIQFDIIRTDVSESFVVQGCAGSGKTQCLIHRLFFLRDMLGQKGWSKVLLITPTQLFRNYSLDLMRRFHLTDVNNISLADFYFSLLLDFDQRFKNRQYQFEMTEEYLPDEYLHQVYANEQIKEIEQEIYKAITAHVEEGCRIINAFHYYNPFTEEQDMHSGLWHNKGLNC